MKNLFLIRHGQTLGNSQNFHQLPNTPLTERGLREAAQLALRLREAQIDTIFSSPFTRAQQTAQEIATLSGKNFQTLHDLRERKRPSEIEGQISTAPQAVAVKAEIRIHENEQEWHHSDEENFWDFSQRVSGVQNVLQQEKGDDVLVVTHGGVIRMFLCLCLCGEDASPKALRRFHEKLSLSNTGITHCSFSEEEGWRVIRVNDTEHLSGN